jgi:hypothetical protein
VIPIRSPLVDARRGSDPERVGFFQVMARLGSGGFGTVYACRHYRTGELAAVKMVHPHVADMPEFRGRFESEVSYVELVRSDYVPRLLAHATSGDPAWLATELVPGLALDRVIRARGTLPEAAGWRLGAGMAEGLAAIHEARLVHRDLKPQNVLLAPDRPWIIDFGLAHLAELPHKTSSRLPIATYQYAAPEQLRSGLLGAEAPADVFAFGATLLFAVTGHPPHEAESHEELFMRALRSKPNLAGLPRGLFGVVESCLQRSPQARPTLSELRAEFARQAEAAPSGRRQRDESLQGFLPDDVLGILSTYQRDLADLLGAQGPARLGWGFSYEPRLGVPSPLPGFLPVDEGGVLGPAWSSRDLAGAGPVDAGTTQVTQVRPALLASRASLEADASLVAEAEVSAPGWRRQLSGWTCAPAAIQGSACVIALLDGFVAGIRVSDRGDLWPPVALGAPVNEAPALIQRGTAPLGYALASAADGSVHAIDLVTGQSRQVLSAGRPIAGRLAAAGERAYALLADGSLLRIAAATGECALIASLPARGEGGLTVAQDLLLAADEAGVVHALDALTGRPYWQLETGSRVLAAPLVVSGRVYVSSANGMLQAADAIDGAPLGSVDLGGAPVYARAAHHAGTLYVGGSDGRVHALAVRGPAATRLEHRWPPRELGDEIVGLAVSDDTIYVAAGYKVTKLAASTGEHLGEITELNCLIAAEPVIAGRNLFIVGLGGSVRCVPLNLSEN